MSANQSLKGDAMAGTDGITRPDDLFDRIRTICRGRPRVAILMSGTGSNARKILEERYRYDNLNFVAVATDNIESQASLIATQYRLSFIFAKQHDDFPPRRKSFFYDLSDKLRFLKVDFLVYAGFMKITPKDFLTEFPGINIHPADLTILNDQGTPKYIGMNAVANALAAGESHIASTVHVVDVAVDGGTIIAVSKHIKLESGIFYDSNNLQDELKRRCEHVIYPQVLSLLAQGTITQDLIPLHAEHQNLNALFFSQWEPA